MDVYAILDGTGKITELFFGYKYGEVVDGNSNWEAWYSSLYGQKCIHVSKHRIRKLHSITLGRLYHEPGDVFVLLQPHPSWVLDENYDWKPPVSDQM